MSDPIEIVVVTAENTAVLDTVADDVFDAPIDPDRLALYLSSELNVLLVAVDTTMEPPTIYE